MDPVESTQFPRKPWVTPSVPIALREALREAAPATAYATAALSVAGILVVTLAAGPLLGGLLTTLFLTAIILCGWFGGLRPALLAAVLSVAGLEFATRFHAVFGISLLHTLLFAAAAAVSCLYIACRRYAERQMLDYQKQLETWVRQQSSQMRESNAVLQRQQAEKEQAEETIRSSEEQFRLLFEEAPVAYQEIDERGIIGRVNHAQCHLLGYAATELIGKPVWELVAPEQREECRQAVLAKMRGEKDMTPLTRYYMRSDGERVCVEIHENLIQNARGAILGIRSSLLDITGRLRAEEESRRLREELEYRVAQRTLELQRSNEALQQFAYSASHDMQEPLRMVSSYTRLIDQRYGSLFDEDGREFLHYVVDGAERMTAMIRDLLIFSRAGAADDSSLEEFPMEEVVCIAVANLQGAIEDAGAHVQWDALPSVRSRRAGLAQVVQNLLANSLRYRSEAVPEIRISAEANSSGWTFCVADNGIGFEQDRADLAFGIFKRLHGKEYPGTGMGLAICKRIIERHGGRIWAQSSPGQGSKFYFSLPAQNN